CINALGLPAAFRAPCLMLVTVRGQWGEFNPWQVPMGQGARPALEAMGVKCFPVDKAAEVGETFAAAADLAFHGRLSAAVLVSQRLIVAKGFEQKCAQPSRPCLGRTRAIDVPSSASCGRAAAIHSLFPALAAPRGTPAPRATATSTSTPGVAWASR